MNPQRALAPSDPLPQSPKPKAKELRPRRPSDGRSVVGGLRRWPWGWIGRLVLAAGLAVAVGYLPYHLYLRSGLSRFVSLRGELLQLVARNQKLRAGIVELRLQLERLQEDSDAVERVARDELGMIRPGEMVYKVE
jgi:cell division protein FtsB